MLKEHATFLRRLMMATDIIVVVVAYLLAYGLSGYSRTLSPVSHYGWLGGGALFLWSLGLNGFGMYESFRVRPMREIVGIILKAGLFGFVALSSLVFMAHATTISRALIGHFFVLATGLLIIEKWLLITTFRWMRQSGYNYRRLLIVGTGRRAQQFIDRVHAHAEWGFKIVGLVDRDSSLKGTRLKGHEILGTFSDVPGILHDQVIDDVVFVVPRSWLGTIEPLMCFCETEGVKVNLAVDFFDFKISRSVPTDFDGLPLISFYSTPDKLWHLAAKRALDVVVSALTLILLAPLFLIVALLVKLSSPGPIFFTQERCGLNRRHFTFYKFRTMVQHAEAMLPSLLSHNEMDGPAFKMAQDPRVTPLGCFLRKTSLDELPQLWNVLKGDMSLVGPRPPLPSEVKHYDSWQRRKLSMRPGLTCLWQVNGRNNITTFNDWVTLDLKYIDTWSLVQDWKILLKTVPIVFLGIGAK